MLTEPCVAILVQELRQLRSLARARLADDDDDLILANDAHQLIAYGKGWEELALLLERLAPREVGRPLVGLARLAALLHMGRKARV